MTLLSGGHGQIVFLRSGSLDEMLTAALAHMRPDVMTYLAFIGGMHLQIIKVVKTASQFLPSYMARGRCDSAIIVAYQFAMRWK